MKRYIKSSVEELRFKDIVNTISQVVLVYDASNYVFSKYYDYDEENDIAASSRIKKPRVKLIWSEEDVNLLLDKISSFEFVYVEPRYKNNKFQKEYEFTFQDYLDVLRNLPSSSYLYTTKSTHEGHFGNDLVVLVVKGPFKLSDGREFRDLNLFIKIDASESSKDAAVCVSFHKASAIENGPYSK